jgi:hypothetical protein
VGTTGTWDALGGGAVSIATINNQPPIAGNFNMVGTANQIAVAAVAGADTFSLVGPYTPATYTAHGVLIGEGATSIVATAAGTNGQVLTGATGADPAFAALGTNSGLTAHGVLIGEGNGAIVALAAAATGTLLAGNTAADPSFTASPSVTGSITAGTGITSTTGNIVATAGEVNAGTTMTAGTGITATTGNISATAGAVSAGTTVTGGTGVTATTGNVTATAGAVNAGTSMTATAGDITATLGNVIINGAAKQLRVHGGAVTDFIGQATLTNGTVTVANTNIAATDRVFVNRSAKNGSTAYGVPLITITAATNFVLTACKSDTTTETNDASTFDYFIVRQV